MPMRAQVSCTETINGRVSSAVHSVANPNAAPAYKGHDLPRLRGVMSPNSYNDEDLRVLGNEWKANLIRWCNRFVPSSIATICSSI